MPRKELTGTMTDLSEVINSLEEEALISCITDIPNEKFLYTLAAVDDSAKERLLSAISRKAQKHVERDFRTLEKDLKEHWSKVA